MVIEDESDQEHDDQGIIDLTNDDDAGLLT
jgi:hypothetical protein